jgi:hypothetical protein
MIVKREPDLLPPIISVFFIQFHADKARKQRLEYSQSLLDVFVIFLCH